MRTITSASRTRPATDSPTAKPTLLDCEPTAADDTNEVDTTLVVLSVVKTNNTRENNIIKTLTLK